MYDEVILWTFVLLLITWSSSCAESQHARNAYSSSKQWRRRHIHRFRLDSNSFIPFSYLLPLVERVREIEKYTERKVGSIFGNTYVGHLFELQEIRDTKISCVSRIANQQTTWALQWEAKRTVFLRPSLSSYPLDHTSTIRLACDNGCNLFFTHSPNVA